MPVASLTYANASHVHPAAWKKDGTDPSFKVTKNIVLQCTDVSSNHNKFYSLELQEHTSGVFRLFSHYGRTDDLVGKGDSAGAKECRYADKNTLLREYDRIVKSKIKKGYQEINLASSKIGSHQAQGNSVGTMDDKTIAAMKPEKKQKKSPSSLHPSVEKLVESIYHHAGKELTSKANIAITAKGFETPLGILTVGQVEIGMQILSDLRPLLSVSRRNKKLVETLSSRFFTAIPHKIGRSAAALHAAILDSEEKVEIEEELLQLMKDMLEVNKVGGTNLFASKEIRGKYDALQTEIDPYEISDIADYFHSTQSPHHPFTLKATSIFSVARIPEKTSFNPANLGNIQKLFHGTRRQNVVGIMNRGLLLPRQVSKMGVSTNGAMFGNAIYSSCHSTKSASYCDLDYKTKFYMFVLQVALGKIKSYEFAQSSLLTPPTGYDSVKGTASVSRYTSGKLIHDEYMVYNTNQQKLAYCIEFEAKRK